MAVLISNTKGIARLSRAVEVEVVEEVKRKEADQGCRRQGLLENLGVKACVVKMSRATRAVKEARAVVTELSEFGQRKGKGMSAAPAVLRVETEW